MSRRNTRPLSSQIAGRSQLIRPFLRPPLVDPTAGPVVPEKAMEGSQANSDLASI